MLKTAWSMNKMSRVGAKSCLLPCTESMIKKALVNIIL